MRGSFIGHGDYISHALNQMARLSVSSSNSLRRTSPSLRKRAKSMGRIGEVTEGDGYQYEEMNAARAAQGSPAAGDWQERLRSVRSESGSPRVSVRTKPTAPQPNGSAPRAKSVYEVCLDPVAQPREPRGTSRSVAASPPTALRGGEMGRNTRTFDAVRGQPISTAQRNNAANQRPASCLLNNSSSNHTPSKANFSPKPDRISMETPRRPHSSYDLKVSNLYLKGQRPLSHLSYFHFSW